jgi:hypothetical protein
MDHLEIQGQHDHSGELLRRETAVRIRLTIMPAYCVESRAIKE